MAYSVDELKQIVNKAGASFNNPYESFVFKGTSGRNKAQKLMIKIYNKKRKESKVVFLDSIFKNYNPFNVKRSVPKEYMRKAVNKIGSSSKNKKEQFRFVSWFRDSQNYIVVKIKNRKTGEIKYCRYSMMVHRKENPFCETQNRHEIKVVHPKVKKELLKMGFLEIDQEVRISKRSRLDFLCTTKKGKKIIIEVKSDKRKHSLKELKTQTKKYDVDARRVFKGDFAGVFLVSLKGIHGGYALKDLSKILRQKGVL